jgi:3-isopropylmalate/(R)-2-methylmalate dehydratase small subunit
MNDQVRGRAILLRDGVSTDAMIAGKYCRLADPRQLGLHLFEGTGFNRKGWKGTIILAGKNFGCGSSREQAPLALKAAGVRAVAARSFGRIFFRNAVNIGLPVMNIEGIPEHVREGDAILLDLEGGVIRNRTREIIRGRPLPDILMVILRAGGLVPYTRAKLRAREKDPPS